MLDSGSNYEIVQLILGGILLFSIWYLVINFFYKRIRISNLSQEDLKFYDVRLVYNDLKKKTEPNKNSILKYADNLETRVLLFEVLRIFNKSELFPKKFLIREKASESFLANWLSQNRDYDNLPDKVIYCEDIMISDRIDVFKFMNYEPHIFANKGWMYGYVGYDSRNDSLYSKPFFIDSDFNNSLLGIEELKNKYDIIQ